MTSKTMETRYLADLTSLSMSDKVTLAKASVQTVFDLLLKPPSELAKKCKVWQLTDVNRIIDLVCNELCEEPVILCHGLHQKDDQFTTGEPQLDETLGGGFQTGVLWEICGENNAGKTQLALQLSLAVQLPQRLGGIYGSACYVTTRETLQTERLQQIIDHHPVLSSSSCGLSDIYTLKAINFGALTRILTDLFPDFAHPRAGVTGAKPAKLLIIDTFTDLFDSSKHPEYDDLKQRARDLRHVSLLLHQLVSNYQLAVVLLGATRTSHPRLDGQDHSPGELSCNDQERWFSRGHSLRGEEAHEALLGPIWSNQLNVRIMMTRTLRTRTRSEVDPRSRDSENGRAAKRRRLDSSQPSFSSSTQPTGDEQLAFRHMSVMFSSIAPAASCDYVILERGIVAFPPEEPPPSTFLYASSVASQSGGTPWSSQVGDALARAHAPALSAAGATAPPAVAMVEEEDDEESLWRLAQEQGGLFDQLDQELDKEVEGEEGPPAEDCSASTDSDFYWND